MGTRGPRGLVLVLLVYVTLDLSLPGMPGAFVFDPGDSLDGLQGHRGRGAATVVIAPAPARDPLVVPRARALAIGWTPTHPVGVQRDPVVNRLPRATVTAAPSSEDPH